MSLYSGLHFVTTVVNRKLHLKTAVGRASRVSEGRLAIAQFVGANDEVLIRIERFAGADQVIDLVMVQAPTVHEQNDVALRRIQIAVSNIGHLEIGDDTSRL